MDTLGGIGNARMTVAMGDAAPIIAGKTLAHFVIGVREVDAVSGGQIVPLIQLPQPYTFDLLSYQNGAALSLGGSSVPAQQYDHLRVVIDTNTAKAIFADGTSMPVSFLTNQVATGTSGAGAATSTTADPAGGAVDVSIPLATQLASGGSASLQLDFNALESLAIAGNVMNVRPAVFGVSAYSAGAVSGSVVNQSGAPVQNAVVAAIAANGSVANTAATDANGNYNIHALNAGTYALVIYNAYTNAAGESINATGQSSTASTVSGPTVTVTAGTTSLAGNVAD